MSITIRLPMVIEVAMAIVTALLLTATINISKVSHIPWSAMKYSIMLNLITW